MNNIDVTEKLLRGKIGIIPTDTIYGVTASAFAKKAIARAYQISKRNPRKPFIILIGSVNDLDLFGFKPDQKTKDLLENIWPGKISAVLPISSSKLKYLHRGAKSLAFRLPKKKFLLDIIKKTGPLISTSANQEGAKPAKTIAEAKRYFGKDIDFYVDSGKMKSLPSTLVEIKDGKITVLRQGAGRINLVKN